MEKFIRIVSDFKEINEANNIVNLIVDKPIHFKEYWIKKNKWCVVPVVCASHIDDKLAEQIYKGFSKIDCNWFYGIATEDVGKDPKVYKFKNNIESILEFSWIRGSFNFLIIPENVKAAVLLTVEDFCLIGGDKNFVTTALGKSIEEARKEFWKFANEGWDEMESVRRFLTSVAKRYENYNG